MYCVIHTEAPVRCGVAGATDPGAGWTRHSHRDSIVLSRQIFPIVPR